MSRLVLLVSSPRVAPGLLSWPAWDELNRAGAICCGEADHPLLPWLAGAGLAVTISAVDSADPRPTARALVAAARAADGAAVVWLTAHDGEPELTLAIGDVLAAEGGVDLEVLPASWDLPGSRLLDVVAVMDRLRSAGGCPWDAEQTHASLGSYLLEEAYEAYDAILREDDDELREELGDVLLQVVFHARVAQEGSDGAAAAEAPGGVGRGGWTIDDVAAGLVDKLVRRHPHVFADVEAGGTEAVVARWEDLKQEEKQRVAAADGVPIGLPTLALTEALHRRAAKAGRPDLLGDAAIEIPVTIDGASVGALLEAVVRLAVEHRVDVEAALRSRALTLHDALASTPRRP